MRGARPVGGRFSGRAAVGGRGGLSPPYNVTSGTPAIGDDDPTTSPQIELLDDDAVTYLADDDVSIYLADDY